LVEGLDQTSGEFRQEEERGKRAGKTTGEPRRCGKTSTAILRASQQPSAGTMAGELLASSSEPLPPVDSLSRGNIFSAEQRGSNTERALSRRTLPALCGTFW